MKRASKAPATTKPTKAVAADTKTTAANHKASNKEAGCCSIILQVVFAFALFSLGAYAVYVLFPEATVPALQNAYEHSLEFLEDKLRWTCVGNFDAISHTWHNFNKAEKYKLTSDRYKTPSSIEEIQAIVQLARKENKSIRVVGSGHAFNDITEPTTDGYLVSLRDSYNKVISVDKEKAIATVQAGMPVRDMLIALKRQYGLAITNMGNYYEQTIGGVITTGTHGTTGKYHTDTFTSFILRLRVVNGLGEVVDISPEDSVTLGAIGVVCEVTIQLEAMYYHYHKVYAIDDIIAEMDPTSPINYKTRLADNEYAFYRWVALEGAGHRATLETFNKADKKLITPVANIVYQAETLAKYWLFGGLLMMLPKSILVHMLNAGDFSHKYDRIDTYYLAYAVPGLIADHIESEWAIPRENLLPALRELDADLGKFVGHKPLEFHIRFSPKDKSRMNPAHFGDIAWVDANLLDMSVDLTNFFNLMRKYGGRPQWSKLHNLDKEYVAKHYDVPAFNKLRAQHDPQNIFGAGPFINGLFGVPAKE